MAWIRVLPAEGYGGSRGGYGKEGMHGSDEVLTIQFSEGGVAYMDVAPVMYPGIAAINVPCMLPNGDELVVDLDVEGRLVGIEFLEMSCLRPVYASRRRAVRVERGGRDGTASVEVVLVGGAGIARLVVQQAKVNRRVTFADLGEWFEAHLTPDGWISEFVVRDCVERIENVGEVADRVQ